ncbi:Uncharacterised protein [Streptococcus cristatus]|uniref:CAAX amino terminal protease family protein n=1 Tax=Streptococcus cristatus AS 1.3089 TaxID=1302863 RepID=A0ABM5NHP7_STRCR|nr:hypothetical protein [Streptococcus cristatus]AGK70278.1 hypothetical protein I872_00725 [Streptococcus cristatus AS 1.3089]SQI45471.1 Uncharacterised protein [Streptococcus cristatus]
MRLKFQKSIQILLVVMLMQSVLLLLVQPMTDRLVLSRPSLLFISLFLLILFGYASYFSREWRDFKIELRASKRFPHLRYLYFLMIASNAAGLVLLCGQASLVQAPLQQLVSDSFLASSLLLLGMDLLALSPQVGQNRQMKYGKSWAFALGITLFAFLRNLGESSCFLIYLSLGMAFVQVLKAWVGSLELSLLAHLLRNLILIFLLPFCL